MSFQCVLCNAKSSTKFFEKSHYPVQDGLIYESAEKARQAPTGKIELHFCTACGFIWNATFEENKIRYDAAYEISLAASQVYRDFLQETSRRLAERYLTNTSHAIEIGCGDGSFLETLCSIANCTGTGFDPTFRSQHSSNGKVRFFRSFLPDSESLNHADLICCRHVLQQVLKPSSPVTFLNSIRDRIKDRSNIKLYFEVPNAAFIFTPENIWNIVYEYHSYFTQESLRNLFSSNGFSIIEILPCFKGGQYLGIEAAVATSIENSSILNHSQFSTQLKDFQHFYSQTITSWREQLSRMFGTHRRIAGWGAGGRAISFFTALNVSDEIPYVADINIHRQGKFLPVSGQQVVAPEFLASYKPDAILITNRAFEQEIRKQISDLGLFPSVYSF